ncbi:MAG: DUF3892 domain-containing protein [Verrucomicrobiota bacterium]|jgi:hypothetical protein
MAEYQVTCINKPHHLSAHEHIMHIGNLADKWRLTRESAIYQIESKVNQFYTVEKATGKKCYVGVVKEAGKNPYLRTHADGKWNDNLLAQPECDESCKIVG